MANPIWSEKESRWSLRIQRDGITRKFTSVRSGPAGKREVLRRAREWNGNGKSDTITVAAAWALYLVDCEHRCAKYTVVNIKKYGQYYILPRVGKLKLSTMTAGKWQEVVNTARPIGRKLKSGGVSYQSDTLSRKTYSNIRGTIVTFCRFCARSGYETVVPDRLYLPHDSETLGKGVLSPDQIAEVFAATDWYANSWRMMLLTGMRPGECYALRKSDISGNMLQIRRAIDPLKNITPGKSKNAKRVIYLTGLSASVLSDQYRQIEDMDTDLVFPNHEGSLPHPSWTYRQWRKFADSAGISAPLYSLRHTFATLMEGKISLAELKAEMGHSSAMDTIGSYVKSTDDKKARTAEVIDITFRGMIDQKIK